MPNVIWFGHQIAGVYQGMLHPLTLIVHWLHRLMAMDALWFLGSLVILWPPRTFAVKSTSKKRTKDFVVVVVVRPQTQESPSNTDPPKKGTIAWL